MLAGVSKPEHLAFEKPAALFLARGFRRQQLEQFPPILDVGY